MASIASFSGLASGVQWNDMIDQIMQLESQRRLVPVTNRIKLQEQRKSAWNEYNNLVGKLRDASKLFQDGTAFGAFKTTVSNSAVSGRALVSATAATTAAPGSYDVEVFQLAQAEKIGSGEVTDASAALGLAGTFHVNGRAVTLAAGDSLTTLRDKINAVNAGSNASGVTATILSTSSSSHRLILSANNSGSRGIELVDSASGVLQDPRLGILTGAQSANAATEEAGWTDTIRFSSRAEVLKDVLGVSPPPAVSNILVGGVQVEIDFNSDTLNDVLLKIQAADPNAKLREETVNGKTSYRLSTSLSVAADPGSPESLRNLELLGFVKNGHAAQINAGQDARLRIDGFDLTRRTNTVTDAIAGVSLDLLATDVASRTLTASGTGLAVAREAKTIDAGTYEVRLTDDGMGTITGATIGGEAAVWDAGTRTIRGANGSTFEGLELTYNGAVTSGKAGDLTVAGDVSVQVKVERDTDENVKKVEEFVDLYNKMSEFVKRQRDTKGPLATDASLRSMLDSLRDVVLNDVPGLSTTNPFTRLALAGVEFTRFGTLKLDAKELRDSLATNASDVREMFGKIGEMMQSTAKALTDGVDGAIKLNQETISTNISSLKRRELDIEARLERRRADLVKQFTAMESAMSRIQSQGNWMASQLSALSSQ